MSLYARLMLAMLAVILFIAAAATTLGVWLAASLSVGLAAMVVRLALQPVARITAAVAADRDAHSPALPVEAAGEVGLLARSFQRFLDQKRLFRAITENVGDAIMTINDRGEIESANPAAERMYGYDDGQLVGVSLNALSGEPAGRQPGDLIAAHALRPSARPGELGAQESRGRRKDGSAFPIEIIISHTVVNGRLLFIAATRDISQRKVAEAERLESEQRFTTLFQTSPALIAIASLDDDRCYEVNQSYLRTFGLHRDEVIGRTTDEIGIKIDAQDRAAFQAALSESGTVRNRDLRLRGRDGRLLVMLTSAEVVQIDGRRFVLTTGIDITEYRKNEDQLRQVQKMEAVGLLAGGIAHDFNNLLTLILGTSELLREGLPDVGGHREMLDAILHSAERGADLTQHLLAFSRRQTLDPEVTDANDAIRSAEHLLRRTVGENVAIRLSLAPELSDVLVDRAQLETALLNLAVNARDAMPNGGTIAIESDETRVDETYARMRPDLKVGTYVRISVSDTGTGMRPEVLAQAFEPFFTTKGPGKGTGLGLSMVYGFVTQSGGTVTIYSELGHGTMVAMYLPVAERKARTVHVAPWLPALAAAAETQPAKGHVLLVEDDANLRALVITQLSAFGYTVEACGDGPSAVKLFADGGAFEMLLTDVILPGGMNGRELADRLSATRPDLRVLFTSGYSQQAIEIQGVLMPGATLLHKPFRKAELGRKLREVTEGQPYARIALAPQVKPPAAA